MARWEYSAIPTVGHSYDVNNYGQEQLLSILVMMGVILNVRVKSTIIINDYSSHFQRRLLA